MISVTKEGVGFSTRGDIGTANTVLRQNTSVDKVWLSFFLFHASFFMNQFLNKPRKLLLNAILLKND